MCIGTNEHGLENNSVYKWGHNSLEPFTCFESYYPHYLRNLPLNIIAHVKNH